MVVATGKSASLQFFGETAEKIAATTKKLEKAALLLGFLHTLGDEDLSLAARYFAGHQFPLSDMRTTNVGSSVLREALSEATGVAVEDLRPRYVRLGDSGDVAFEVIREVKGEEQEPSITLSETNLAIETLSE